MFGNAIHSQKLVQVKIYFPNAGGKSSRSSALYSRITVKLIGVGNSCMRHDLAQA
jgi:hypothetical protein